jgi:hypothetical protein
MPKKKILFIGGSLNQTIQMHKVSMHLEDCDCYFTAYYCDGIERMGLKIGILDFSSLGGRFRRLTEDYFRAKHLQVDYEGRKHNYDLVVTSNDLIFQKNIRKKSVVLVQEGMTDREGFMFKLIKTLHLPRYFASTSMMGLSDGYKAFCVASDGYKEMFIKKGCKPEKIVVTGVPNFDNIIEYSKNNFHHKDYVMVATSDARETFRYENRIKFIKKAVEIADGRDLIFKLHPNENDIKAEKEIRKFAPGALVFSSGNAEEMVANCSVFISKVSTLIYVALILGKEIHCDIDIEELKMLAPVQNGGVSAKNIADVCRKYL